MTESTATTAPCLAGEFRPVTEIAVPVLGVDRYDRSLAVAADLAERWEVPVRILHIRLPDDPVDNDQFEAVRSAFHHQHPQVPVESTLVTGDDVPAAVESIVEPTALVLMRSDHADREVTPSTAERILRKVGVAMIVGPSADSEHVVGPVTVALDGSPTAERALDPALAFAHSLDQPVHLVQVVDAATTSHVARLRDGGERVSESGYLQSVAERLEAEEQNVRWEVIHEEDPVAGVLGAVQRRGGGPLVVGSHGDSALGRRMLGSTAMGLVADNTYPVLVVSTANVGEAELTT